MVVVTIAKRLLKPVIGLGVLVNFCRKASLRLCAGSVEIMRTFLLTAASWTARLHAGGRCQLFDSPNAKQPEHLEGKATLFGAMVL